MLKSRSFWLYGLLAIGIFLVVSGKFGVNVGFLAIAGIAIGMGTAEAVGERNQRKVLVPAFAVGFVTAVLTLSIGYGFIAAVFTWVAISLVVQVSVQNQERKEKGQ